MGIGVLSTPKFPNLDSTHTTSVDLLFRSYSIFLDRVSFVLGQPLAIIRKYIEKLYSEVPMSSLGNGGSDIITLLLL